MGLGKTIQSIGYMAALQHHLHKKGPFLIVVPLSVLSNWISEIEKFCPSFRAVRFHGMALNSFLPFSDSLFTVIFFPFDHFIRSQERT